jgi:hypothetical protein
VDQSLAEGTLVCLLVEQRLAAIADFAPGGREGRPGAFALHKVFPEAFLSV